jgi:hypothetical protein
MCITFAFQMLGRGSRPLRRRDIKRTKTNTRPRRSTDGRKRRCVLGGVSAGGSDAASGVQMSPWGDW